MFIAGKPNYALLGRRESYSIGNRQTKKDALFAAALRTIHDYIDNPNFVSIPDLVTAIYRGDDPQLKPIREALKSNSLFPCTTCLSASGNKILAYLAVLHDQNCLAENGDINLDYTKQIIRSFFRDETKNTIQFDDSAIRNLKATDTHFRFGKKRFAHLALPFSRIDNIHTIQNRRQPAYQPQELELPPLNPLNIPECTIPPILVNPNVPAAPVDQDAAIELMTERLFQALAENNLSAAKEALRNGAKANALYQPVNTTPLMWAVYNGWLDLAIDLLSKSSEDSINTVDTWGRTAILIACNTLTDIPFLTQLLARSSDEATNVVDESGDTALLWACRNLTNIPFLAQILARSSDETVNVVDHMHQTALMWACRNLTNISFLAQLLTRSSDEAVNVVTRSGQTALIWACNTLTDIPFLAQLFARSSDMTFNVITQSGQTALMWACGNLMDIPFLTQLFTRSSDSTVNTVSNRGKTALITLVSKPSNHETAHHLVPLLLPRLTGKNLHSAYKQANMNIAKTAWQIAHEHGTEPWMDIARRIGEAMLIKFAQSQIPRGNNNESLLSDPMMALAAINGFLQRHLQQKGAYQDDGSQLLHSVDDAIRALHDTNSLLRVSLAEYEASQTP